MFRRILHTQYFLVKIFLMLLSLQELQQKQMEHFFKVL